MYKNTDGKGFDDLVGRRSNFCCWRQLLITIVIPLPSSLTCLLTGFLNNGSIVIANVTSFWLADLAHPQNNLLCFPYDQIFPTAWSAACVS